MLGSAALDCAVEIILEIGQRRGASKHKAEVLPAIAITSDFGQQQPNKTIIGEGVDQTCRRAPGLDRRNHRASRHIRDAVPHQGER